MNSDNLGAYSIEDLRKMAKKRPPRCIFEYVDGAAEDGIAKEHNREVYRSLKIKNRVLKDVSKGVRLIKSSEATTLPLPLFPPPSFPLRLPLAQQQSRAPSAAAHPPHPASSPSAP